MEIDHILICTENKAPAGDLLVAFGLTEGSSNTHPGQGTANRRFYFHNFMLELLWVEDTQEVQNARTRPMRLFERCRLDSKVSSPFGIAFRPTAGNQETLPFPVWDYHPIYLPEFLKIQVADHTPLSEPMYFYLSFAGRQDHTPVEKREPMEHNVPLKEVTAVKIYVAQETNLSDTACILNQIPKFSIVKSTEHCIELEFGHREHNQTRDFRPALPLILHW